MTECAATLNEVVAKVATPLPLRLPVPSVVMPSRKVTVPVGVPPPVPVTVELNVTDCPLTDGLSDDVTVVVVGFSTTCVSARDVLPEKFESPP